MRVELAASAAPNAHPNVGIWLTQHTKLSLCLAVKVRIAPTVPMLLLLPLKPASICQNFFLGVLELHRPQQGQQSLAAGMGLPGILQPSQEAAGWDDHLPGSQSLHLILLTLTLLAGKELTIGL